LFWQRYNSSRYIIAPSQIIVKLVPVNEDLDESEEEIETTTTTTTSSTTTTLPGEKLKLKIRKSLH